MNDSIPTGNSATDWYTVSAAARKLGISDRAVRARISTGSIQAQRDGARWLVALPIGNGTTDSDASDRTETESVRNQVGNTESRKRPTDRNFRQSETEPPGQQLAILVEQVRAPLALRIGELETQVVAVSERAARAEAERDGAVAAKSETERLLAAAMPWRTRYEIAAIAAAILSTLLAAGVVVELINRPGG